MKIMAFNGSPRKKNWNTVTLLEHALQGAASAGAETELVQLYDLDFSGCISCHQHLHFGIGTETLLNISAIKAFDVAVNGHHSVRITQKPLNADLQVVEGVAIFGENDQFAQPPVGIAHFRCVL